MGLLVEGSVTQMCYATFDVRAAAEKWATTLGAGPFYVIEFSADMVKTYRGQPARDSFKAAIGFLGTTLIELMQPTNDAPSIVRESLDRGGEGALQHIYPNIRPLDADAYDALCAKYRAQGLVEALSFSLPGMGRNCFFDATAELGCFLEVLEFGPEAYASVTDAMYRKHIGWDGEGDVLRPMADL